MVHVRFTKPLILFLVLFAALGAVSGLAAERPHQPITLQLMELVQSNPEVGALLEKSIAKAASTNPDPETNPVRSLADYYLFIDSASELIPKEILANPPDLIRDQILQSICYFYFLVDQELPELADKGLYKDAIQYYAPFSDWLRDFADSWGAFLDTEDSWSQETYVQFYTNPSFGLQKEWYEPASRWRTFNQFFSRYLRSPDVRPIASPDDPSVVVSPADSVPVGAIPIDADSRIRVDGGLGIKLARFYRIPELLGPHSEYAEAFASGVLTHTFLNVNDYHRYHFAVGGKVLEVAQIAQNVALEVNWNQEQGRYDPIDVTGWQFSQTRGYVIVDTGAFGLVALMPMGMAQVSSVNFEQDVSVGSTHRKGDMLGAFLFGGSDFVMLFQDKAGFEMVAPQQAPRSQGGRPRFEHLLMGEPYGRMQGSAD